MPLVDQVLGRDLRQPSPAPAGPRTLREAALAAAYHALPLLYVPVHYCTAALALHTACTAGLHPAAAFGERAAGRQGGAAGTALALARSRQCVVGQERVWRTLAN